MATALNALKRFRVINTDIHPENIMLEDPRLRPVRVKIIDFGLAICRSESANVLFYVGSIKHFSLLYLSELVVCLFYHEKIAASFLFICAKLHFKVYQCTI